jgi:hypothetical protein
MIPEDLAYSLIARARQRIGPSKTIEDEEMMEQAAVDLLLIPGTRIHDCIQIACAHISNVENEIDRLVREHFNI